MKILTNSVSSVGAETITGDSSWQQQIKAAVRDLGTLREMLRLPADLDARSAEASFSVFAPLPFIERVKLGDPNDPLLLQLLPRQQEDTSPSHYTTDPLVESEAQVSPGVLKKYSGRALFIITGACAIHCRYCFRRHFPYQDHSVIGGDWEQAIVSIANDDSIEEIIFSGGDPLMVVDSRLAALVCRLERIPHVRRLRIHTRLPIMIPNRVTSELVSIFEQTKLEIVFVIHANHGNEIDDDVVDAMRRLKTSGAMLLNQSVLLSGVNDCAETLIDLSKRLISIGVLPYYLHQLDQVIGTSHFEVPVSQGKQIINTMRASLPGFAVPRYVQEIPGQPNKTVLA